MKPNNKNLKTIFLIVFADLLGFGIIIPLLPFIAEKYNANYFIIGILVATYSFFQMIFSPILGHLSDKFGRKKLLIISQLGSALGYIILGFSNSLYLVFLSRIIDGITGGNISIAQAYVADVTTKKERAKGMSLIGAALGLGFIFGPAIGGIFGKINYSLPAYIAATVGFGTALLSIIFLKETVPLQKRKENKQTGNVLNKSKEKIVFSKKIKAIIASFFILSFSGALMQGNFTLWTERVFSFGPQENGWFFTYLGILVVFIQLKVIPYLTNKFKEEDLVKIAFLILAIGFIIIPYSRYLWLLIIAISFIAFGRGISNPLINAIMSKEGNPRQQGKMLGILQSVGSLGRVLGPIVGGYIFYTINKNAPFFLTSIIVLLTFTYLLKNIKKDHPNSNF